MKRLITGPGFDTHGQPAPDLLKNPSPSGASTRCRRVPCRFGLRNDECLDYVSKLGDRQSETRDDDANVILPAEKRGAHDAVDDFHLVEAVKKQLGDVVKIDHIHGSSPHLAFTRPFRLNPRIAAGSNAMWWYLLQGSIFFAVVASNIHWQWTPNGHLAAILGGSAAFLVTEIINELRAWQQKRALRNHR
ncbi:MULTISPECIES: hypothetical protein [unclassified Bradyrhizobium]|uniref:hypothetical protein n=1 Tax=unclassified Bradyrhizobium TaxID=2631580 RepID=UPI00247A5361|nr:MULTISPECIES: hypothetical protein [unclassified Bradyrhizobium]WGR67846.1 hypothetical protein MTX24_20470 [Bradyrhizobium sp. ISRA426]WGR79899.1 hypothetical protein MTX21_05585 [Bradyrhizobium sp. ISRA430]WGR83085.1 hypothetical protein MTX25_20150 [Bradyrhizobium sp. ISRA432]